MMKITYIDHSGFFLEMEDACFLFDYYKGTIPKADPKKKLFIFASHVHHDHFNKDIFRLRDRAASVYYILSDDIRTKEKEQVYRIGPEAQTEIDGCFIQALRSTDEGVAFFLQYAGKTIYHAGDLNWWHWNEEGDAYNAQMSRDYRQEIDRIKGQKIDVAFVPVDPRLEQAYCWGIDYFMRQTDTKLVFPMHFWEDYSVPVRLREEACTEGYRERIVLIRKTGQCLEI